ESIYRLMEFNSDSNLTSIQENKVKDLGVLFKAEYSLNPNFKILFGQDFSSLDVDYNLRFGRDNDLEENENSNLIIQSLFIENEIKFKQWYLRFGIRGSYLSDTAKIYAEPRFLANLFLGNHWKLKASAEIKNQAISQLIFFDFNDFGLNNNIWVLANEENDIPLITSKQATFGFVFSKKGWQVNLESYYKNFSGISSFTRGFNSMTQQSDGISEGNSKVYGFDLLLKKKIRRFRSWLGYSFSKTMFEFDTLQSSKFPGNFDQRHVLNFSNTYRYKKFQCALGWSFATGRPYSQATPLETMDETGNSEITPIYDELNTERLNSYHRLDLSALYDFTLGTHRDINVRLGFSVQNLLNRSNELERSFKTGNDQLLEITNFGVERYYNMVLRIWL
ncbi:MAG: TonB-dependent receptor, partial [Bacteroidota bacterium]